MKFSTREDIDAPIEEVFEMVCMFDMYERAAMRRGAEVRRKDTLGGPGLGAQWDVNFNMRGKERHLDVEVVAFEKPTDMSVALTSRSITGLAQFELFALSRNRTRMLVSCEIKPVTMAARLFVQSLKLTKPSLTQKYKDRVSAHARDMEKRYRENAQLRPGCAG